MHAKTITGIDCNLCSPKEINHIELVISDLYVLLYKYARRLVSIR